MIEIRTVSWITPELVEEAQVRVVDRILSHTGGWAVLLVTPKHEDEPVNGGTIAVCVCATTEERDAMVANIKDILYARLS
jgi:hypothetical protein